ncbi:MAG: hypothetical protein H7223_06555, partial [Pedobacter sp.]|nr:hypothetical protein [Pedobacter sp.]
INEDNNFRFYPRKPKLSDCEIIALVLTAESLGIDSENYLFGKLKHDYSTEFPRLIHRCNFNRRRKVIFPWLQQLNEHLAKQMNEGENVFIVDSIPVPICEIGPVSYLLLGKEKEFGFVRIDLIKNLFRFMATFGARIR